MNEMKRGNDTMANEHGSLSINSQNIFPIIKKWMYSDHDIFYRELISNGCDAITKLKKLDLIGEYEAPDDIEYKIQVKVSPEKKTIQIIDNVSRWQYTMALPKLRCFWALQSII